MLKLTNLFENILFEAGVDDLRKNFVESGKIDSAIFDEIVKVSGNKYAYALWLIKKVLDKIVKTEDIYKYEKYFNIFSKYKNQYKFNDINQYKTEESVREFEFNSIKIIDDIRASQSDDGDKSKENLVTFNNIRKLESVGIKFLGVVDGYQCFKIPKELKNDENAYKIYKNVLGDAGGKEIAICTIANFDLFKRYLGQDDFYVFFNKADDLSPYQFCYNAKEFKDRTDREYVY